ncbi:MAG: hypothetical protein MMC33_009303 [Icmadophila ericetorum]|nr:hypothetical protein [Icmadophila ericetorum]
MNIQPPSTNKDAILRPRARRLISIDDEFDALVTEDASRGLEPHSASSSYLPSRTASPIPSTHPSRPASSNTSREGRQTNGKPSGGYMFGSSQVTSSTFTTGLWGTSWSSLQGIASNLLGNDILGTSRDKTNSMFSPPRKRRPFEATHNRILDSSTPGQWGPSGNTDTHVAYGSKEDRLAQVQAKKRETLLLANGRASSETLKAHKRRTSEERVSATDVSEDNDTDALVYLHKVQPNDTLAGVAIKYNCPAAVFRKANRFWPNDSIQIRDIVYLPVDACGIKGRKVPPPTELGINLISCENASSSDLAATPTTPQTARREWESVLPASSQTAALTPASPSISASNASNADAPQPWKHDSWVLLPTHPTPVEIARLPRRTLGYFPPRRKSPSRRSSLSTPTASFDLSRSSTQDLSPSRSPARSRKPTPPSISIAQQLQLQGPGGVGTLGKEALRPGPAPDGLNKLFAQNISLPLPPPSTVAPYCDDPNRESFESMNNSSSGIEELGGAIEGWMRKVGGKVKEVMVSPGMNARGSPMMRGRGAGAGAGSVGGLGIGRGLAEGDLIELVGGFELDGGEEGEEEDREGQERELAERFPPRGRVFEEEGRRRKGGTMGSSGGGGGDLIN